MKFQFLLMFSIISIVLIASLSAHRVVSKAPLLLRQEIVMLESNALRNLLGEQNLLKRNHVLKNTLTEIQKLRAEFPMQLSGDEKAISRVVENLKSMGMQKQAQHKEVL